MRALEDIIKSLFNPKFIGDTLVKRSIGTMALSLTILIALYVLVYGIRYSSITNEFVDAAFDSAKPILPTFDIINGKLKMYSEEPYIITHEDLYNVMYEAAVIVDEQGARSRYAEEMKTGLEKGYSGGNQKTFCLVMDTTGAYKEKVNLDNYSNYVLMTEDSIETVDRVRYMPGNAVPLSERIQQDMSFSPDVADILRAPAMRITTTAIIIGLAIWTPIHFLLKALITAFVVWVVFMIMRKEKSFEVLYKISLYALSPAVLLAIIHRLLFPINGLFFQTIYFIYIITAVLAIAKPEGDVTPKP